VSPPALECVGVSVGYGRDFVLRDVDLAVDAGEVMALLGPSGSGKTTLLHAVAGFVAPMAGEIRLGGVPASTSRGSIAPEHRRVGMVFQHYALWPHMTALDTVAYPLRRAGLARSDARARAGDLLGRVGIGALADRRPHQMSGGEQQRVGLARALAREPTIYLFDEPTAHLDAHLRATVVEELARHRSEAGAAALYATHEPAEALAVADRVAVVHDGRVAQIGTPTEVYARPADRTVAGLTGRASFLSAPWRPAGQESIRCEMSAISAVVECANASSAAAGATLAVRPDWATLGGDLPGLLRSVQFHGTYSEYHVDTDAGTVIIRETGEPRASAGEPTSWSLRRCWLLAD
jgi:ABC-type Fe3+/spermidine/putrescine transport system ATPase subunit